jgi:hypothetical protein
MTTTVLAIGLLAEPSRYRHRDIARLGHFGTRDATQPIASRLGTKANIDTMAYSGCHTSKTPRSMTQDQNQQLTPKQPRLRAIQQWAQE